MRRPLLFFCVCLFALIALGMQVLSPPPWDGNTYLRGADMVISGQVYDKEFREYEGEKVLILFLKSISDSNSELKSKEKVRCEILFNALPYSEDGSVYLPCLGSVVKIRGTFNEFARATNPGEFDLARYYGVEGIVGGLTDARILETGTSHWQLREALFRWKSKWVRNLHEVFEPKEASVLAKMLLGDASGLDEEVRELYQSAGIAHILSISGLHISMLGMGVYHILKKCRVGAKGAAFWGGVIIVLYGLLIGFGVSAARAIGMYLIHMLGEIWGKTYDMLTAMGVLCVVLLIKNPRLVYHSGYLLSFSSVCGVGLLAPVIKGSPVFHIRPYEKEHIKWLKKGILKTLQGLWTSLSISLFTLPVQLWFFYKIPVYSVFINLLVIPFVGVVMIVGFVIMLIPALGFLVPVEMIIFTWFEKVCILFQSLPGHTALIGKPPMEKILVYYAVLLCLILYAKKIGRVRCFGVLAGLVLFVGIRFKSVPQVTFLDVGQGDCAVVQTEGGENFLFDCGSSSKSNVGEKILIPFLQYQGIGKLDGVFLSHPDSDHMNGVLQLLSSGEVEVGKVFLPDYKDTAEGFSELSDLVSAERVAYVSSGMSMEREEVRMVCLHPVKGTAVADDNQGSACYLVEMSGISMLFTGDVSEEREQILSEEYRREAEGGVDILKVAHHGSRFSTSRAFLEETRPLIAVISCGRNNPYGHPHKETVQRLEKAGSRVISTAEQGAVNIRCLSDGPKIILWQKNVAIVQ